MPSLLEGSSVLVAFHLTAGSSFRNEPVCPDGAETDQSPFHYPISPIAEVVLRVRSPCGRYEGGCARLPAGACAARPDSALLRHGRGEPMSGISSRLPSSLVSVLRQLCPSSSTHARTSWFEIPQGSSCLVTNAPAPPGLTLGSERATDISSIFLTRRRAGSKRSRLASAPRPILKQPCTRTC